MAAALHHSRQRDAIWEFLKTRKDHPTADFIYLNMRRQFPNISLGTVYRNLMLLKDMNMLLTVEVGDGVIHFDPNTSEHSHFLCTKCGCVIDMDDGETARIKAAAAKSFSGRIESYSAFFRGLCPNCLSSQ